MKKSDKMRAHMAKPVDFKEAEAESEIDENFLSADEVLNNIKNEEESEEKTDEEKEEGAIVKNIVPKKD